MFPKISFANVSNLGNFDSPPHSPCQACGNILPNVICRSSCTPTPDTGIEAYNLGTRGKKKVQNFQGWQGYSRHGFVIRAKNMWPPKMKRSHMPMINDMVNTLLLSRMDRMIENLDLLNQF